MVCEHSIFPHISVTLYETCVSFLLVTLISIAAAVVLWFSGKLSAVLEPYLVVLNSLPKSALAPLLIVWLGAGQTTVIAAGMSVAIFGSVMTLYTCFTGADQNKIKLVYTLHGTSFHALTKVVLPSSVPTIISNMKVNIGLCLVGVIIGEFLAAKEGLGYLIIYSSQVFTCAGIWLRIRYRPLQAVLPPIFLFRPSRQNVSSLLFSVPGSCNLLRTG